MPLVSYRGTVVPSSCRGIPTFGAATLGARAQPPPRAPQLVAPRVAVTRGLGIDALIRPARNWTLVSLATPQAHTREGPLPWEKSSHNNNRSSSTLPGLKPFYFPCISSVWGSSSIFPYFSHSSPFWLQSPNLQELTCCVSFSSPTT